VPAGSVTDTTVIRRITIIGTGRELQTLETSAPGAERCDSCQAGSHGSNSVTAFHAQLAQQLAAEDSALRGPAHHPLGLPRAPHPLGLPHAPPPFAITKHSVPCSCCWHHPQGPCSLCHTPSHHTARCWSAAPPLCSSCSHCGTAQHSTAQHSTAQHSTAQHSTAQHVCKQAVINSLATVQYSEWLEPVRCIGLSYQGFVYVAICPVSEQGTISRLLHGSGWKLRSMIAKCSASLTWMPQECGK
jgi:hypothetical protein